MAPIRTAAKLHEGRADSLAAFAGSSPVKAFPAARGRRLQLSRLRNIDDRDGQANLVI
jgi:hypothetical protein